MKLVKTSNKPTPRRSNRCILNAYALGASRQSRELRQRVGRLHINSAAGDLGKGNQAQRNARAAGFAAMKSTKSPGRSMGWLMGW